MASPIETSGCCGVTRARYRGVMHEFLSVDSGETGSLDDISLLDHASGSNRVDKYKRDLRLLTQALPVERDPSWSRAMRSISPTRCAMPVSRKRRFACTSGGSTSAAGHRRSL